MSIIPKNQSILNSVSFHAEPGEIIALLGSSGAGKSTLLRCLNLLEHPDAGSVKVGDFTMDFDCYQSRKIPYQTLKALRKRVGMVFQQYHLWAHRTILENLIEAPIHVLKRAKKEVVAEADSFLARMEILDKKDSYPSQLSGGQKQRAAIARALMMHPDVMLFDEPTSALDPNMVSKIINIIKSLAQKGMTTIIATHEMSFARDLADKIVFLKKGHIVEMGDAKKMFSHPQTKAFAEFVA